MSFLKNILVLVIQMTKFNELGTIEALVQLDEIVAQSHVKPVAIFSIALVVVLVNGIKTI
jgi:hypothetical protein